MIGRTISHYRILEELGSGGMGTVYVAEDLELRRRVALKVLPPAYAEDPDRMARFRREAQAVAALNHPHIVTIHSVEADEGLHFLTMELVEGKTLAKVIPPKGLPLSRLLDLALPLAEAVSAAHQRGITHRDLKPANVMVTAGGRLKILDFGLAKLQPDISAPEATQLPTEEMTREGRVLGTMPYMSPEQAQGKPVDQRTDIFSLGVILYEMATGERPFRGETAADLVSAILRDTPPPVNERKADLPRHLGRIIHHCLEKDPQRRFQTALDVSNELQDLKTEIASESAGAAPSSPLTPTARRLGLRRLAVGGAAALAVIASIVIGRYTIGYLETSSGREPVPQIESLAVLPLENLSGDEEQEYFSDGMTEALITDLSKIGALRVISRTSVMQYKGARKSLPEIARELGVDAVVEGSVLRAGERVRVTAQLIEAASDRHLWAESYERDLRDVLALQSEVAQAIAREIEIALTPEEQERMAAARELDPVAHEAYLKGLYNLRKNNFEAARLAREHFRRAIDIDPTYAPPYAGLAELYSGWGRNLLPEGDWKVQARAFAEKAMGLDDLAAESHFSLGIVRQQIDWDWAGARRGFERAIELNPGLADAHHMLAHNLSDQGRIDEALIQSRLFAERDPLSPEAKNCLGFHYFLAGDYEEAIASSRRALEIDPGYWEGYVDLGTAYLQIGMVEQALVQLRKAQELSIDSSSTAELFEIYALAVSGSRGEAEGRLAALLADPERKAQAAPALAAMVYGALGDRDRAFDWLERGYRKKGLWMNFIKLHPFFDPLRSDPRFEDLLRRMNLV